MNRTDIEKVIRECVHDAIKDIDDQDIDDILNEDLSYPIDSIIGVYLIGILEIRLGVHLPDDFLTSENCSSLDMIIETYFRYI